MMQAELELLLREKQKRLAESDLSQFARQAWPVLHPGRELKWSWHYDLLCEYLTLVYQRKVRRLIINVPPRTAKSTFAAVFFPDWVWLQEPGHGFLCASYSQNLSTEHSVARRNLIQSEWFQTNWSDKFRLASDQNVKTQFDNDKSGQMIATSVGGTATGKGGDTAIIDDPVSADQALSDAERSTANKWFDNTLRSRLNDPATGAIILIMQRLHELDTTGFLMESEPKEWMQVKIPLKAEADEEYVFPISGRVVVRKQGEILQPERFGPELASLERRSLVFAGQYQQRPAPLEGNIIKRAHVRYYGGVDPVTAVADEPLPEKFDLIITSADCAFKDLDSSDFVCVGTIGVKGRKRCILKIVNKHLGLEGTEAEIRRQRAEFHSTATLVEDKANGSAVISKLKRDLPGVIAVDPEGGKLSRLFAASIEWEAGDWYVDRNAAETEPFIIQICTFPNAAHDDMADMMTQASIWLQKHGFGLFELYRQQAEEITKPQPKHEPTNDAKELAASQKKGIFAVDGVKRLGKVATVPQQTDCCPKCGNKFLSRYCEGTWKCNACGERGQDTKGA